MKIFNKIKILLVILSLLITAGCVTNSDESYKAAKISQVRMDIA